LETPQYDDNELPEHSGDHLVHITGFINLPLETTYSFQLDWAGECSMVLDSNVVAVEADVDVQSGLNRVDIYHFSSESKTLTFKYKCDTCGVSAFTVPGNTSFSTTVRPFAPACYLASTRSSSAARPRRWSPAITT